LEDCLVNYADLKPEKPNKKTRQKYLNENRHYFRDNNKSFRFLIDQIVKFNEVYKRNKRNKQIKVAQKTLKDQSNFVENYTNNNFNFPRQKDDKIKDEFRIKVEEDSNDDLSDGNGDLDEVYFYNLSINRKPIFKINRHCSIIKTENNTKKEQSYIDENSNFDIVPKIHFENNNEETAMPTPTFAPLKMLKTTLPA